MNDCIRIHELEVQTHIGVPEEERLEETGEIQCGGCGCRGHIDEDGVCGHCDYEND